MKKTDALLNEQINHELYSAYLYLAMAAYFHDRGLKGFGKWFEVQAKEELEHAMKFYNHLLEKGVRVELKEIARPKSEWSSPKEAVKEALEHEKKVTSLIYNIGKTAMEEGEFGTWQFLGWFYEEQIEEEDIFRDLLSALEMVGEDGTGLYLLDKELGQRGEE